MADYSQNSGKTAHLTKDQRVPKCYKEVEKVLQAVKSCQGNVKTVMYNSKLSGSVFRKVYALAVNVLKYRTVLEKILEETELLKKEPLRKEMAGIMVYEMIFGKGLPGESKPVQMMMKYQDDILKIYDSLKDVNAPLTGLYTLPEYVRVNTLKTSVSTILKDLEDWEYQQIFYEDNVNLDEYLDLVKSLETGSFLIDYHFKDLLVFASKENLSSWPLYQKGHVFIQDKSSYLPVHALDPKPDSSVLDACAAPGMKTIHIASLMQNTGKIYAFERDQKRFETLKNMLKSADVKICSSGCADFYLVNKDSPKYSYVESILVDPSCSGSGMVNRMDEVTDTEESKNKLRLQKLAGFQILLLKHALSFPSVKRVVYSTCSITEEENEFVVHEVLNHYKHSFKLAPVMPNWPIRGFDHYEFGTLCLRAFPEKSLTNGFFVAMFERLGFEEQQQLYESSFADSRSVGNDKYKKKKRKSELQENNRHDDEYSLEQNSEFGKEENPNSETVVSDKNDLSQIKYKKKKLKPEFQDNQYSENYAPLHQGSATELMTTDGNSSCVTENDDVLETPACDLNWDENENTPKKKHKKKHKHKDEMEFLDETHSEPYLSEPVTAHDADTKKRKKKHHSENTDLVEESVENDEVGRVKHKKSKRVKLEDKEIEDQPIVVDEAPLSEGKKKHKKAKNSHLLNNEESNRPDIEHCSEVAEAQEIIKKKHKKKCKDKKHKGD